MHHTYRIRKQAKNEFSALAGIVAIKVQNGSDCIIVDQATHKGIPIQRYAYNLYNNLKYPNKCIYISLSCNTLNCVAKDHLIAKYMPNKTEADYIRTFLKVDGIEQIAHAQKIPQDLLLTYCKENGLI